MVRAPFGTKTRRFVAFARKGGGQQVTLPSRTADTLKPFGNRAAGHDRTCIGPGRRVDHLLLDGVSERLPCAYAPGTCTAARRPSACAAWLRRWCSGVRDRVTSNAPSSVAAASSSCRWPSSGTASRSAGRYGPGASRARRWSNGQTGGQLPAIVAGMYVGG